MVLLSVHSLAFNAGFEQFLASIHSTEQWLCLSGRSDDAGAAGAGVASRLEVLRRALWPHNLVQLEVLSTVSYLVLARHN